MSVRDPDSDGEGTVPFPPAAGFWRRLLAWLLDLLWIVPAAWFSVSALESRLSWGARAAWLGVGLLLVLLVVATWRLWGATPAKALLGLRILGADGLPVGGRQILLRGAGYLVSSLTLGLGFVMVGLNASRRGLHDQLSGTYVAEVRRGRGGRRRRRRRRGPVDSTGAVD